MKKIVMSLGSLLVLLAGCATDSVLQEHIIVTPHALKFSGVDTMGTVSITHSCSCPFSWSDSIRGGANWLVFPSGMNGDQTKVSMTVLRTLLPSDSNYALVYVNSNGYGSDTIGVTAIK